MRWSAGGELKELAVREAGSTWALADTLQVSIPLLHFRDMAERVLPQFPFERPMPPTVGPTLAQGVVRREPYGVAALISAYNFANDSEFGRGGVWARDPVRAYEIAKRIRAGMVYVNGGGAGSSPHTAFGGYKQSGLGLERGEYGLDEFLLSKSIIWSAR